MKKRTARWLVGCLTLLVLACSLQAGECLVKDGDRVVFYGDSITEQRLYTSYIEAFLLTRFPQWDLTFRNAGWSGDTAEGALKRLERDVLSLKPTLVTLCFGMNDGGYTQLTQERLDWFGRNYVQLVNKLKNFGARVVIVSPTAVDETRRNDTFSYNETLAGLSKGLVQISETLNVPFINQFSPFTQLLQNLRDEGVDLAVIPDSVHPGREGHLVMAWVILSNMNVSGLVSKAEISADGEHVSTEGCIVVELRTDGDKITFVRQDDCLPMPVDTGAQRIVEYVSVLQDLSQFELKVTGLQDDVNYKLSIDGELAGTATGAQWGEGRNLSLSDGPIRKQTSHVLDLVFQKSNLYLERWRSVQLWTAPNWLPARTVELARQDRLDELDAKIAEIETQLKEAVRPKPHEWVIEPMVADEQPKDEQPEDDE